MLDRSTINDGGLALSLLMIALIIVGDEIKDKTITSTWDEAYSDPTQVPIGQLQELEQRNSKKCLMD